MAANTLNTRILLRSDTTANWNDSTLVMLKGEVGIEYLDSGEVKAKAGNGTDVWADLPYSTLTPTEINALITTLNASAHTHSNKSVLDATTASFTTALKTKLDGIATSADNVTFTQALTSGTKVGTITINGSGIDLYAPTNTNTTYDLGASASAANGNVKINLTGSNSTTDSVSVKGAGSVTVTSDVNGVITVTGTDTKYSHPNSGVTTGTYKSVTVNAQGHVTSGTNPTTLSGYGITDAVKSSEKGSANGVATLGSDGKVPSSQLPSYVDDVIEGYLSGGKLYKESAHTTEITGESGKIYVDLTSSKTYRWSGTAFVVISETIALGETSSTAYRGDRGKVAYDHSQSAHAPSNAEANQNAFSNVTVGSTTVAAGAKTDTLTIAAGSNVTITPDATNKKVTITAKDTTYSAATTSVAGLMSAADKTKLDGIASGANNYVHPTTSGNKHIPSGGSSGQILRWSADGTAVWGADNNTTYSAFKGATADAAGGSGLVPAPAQGAQTKYLRADGTWQTPPNTTYSTMTAATADAAGKTGLVPAPAAGKQTSFLRGDATWVAPGSITAGAATKLATARTIALSGAATGTATSFNGTANITIPVTSLNAVNLTLSSSDTLILNGGGAS